MPYSGQTFTIVNTFIPNTTIESSAVNQNFNDIASNGLSVVVKLNGDSTMTGQFKSANGTVSAPGMSFGSDTNIGFYRVGSDQLGVTIGGVLQGYWTSTGWTSYSGDAGAAVGPVLTLYRDSATPAASDIIGQVSFEGEDSAGNQQQYAGVQATILDATDTSEDAKVGFSTAVAGTVAERGYFGQGLVVGSPTGADKGAGSINASSFYADNVQIFPAFPLPGATGFTCTNNSGTPNTQLDVAASVVVMANTSNLSTIATSVSVTINAGTTGANGIDTGSLGANTWYYVYLINNGTTTAGLLSASSTSPTLPSGYTYFVRLGAVKTGGSSTFLRTLQKGRTTQYRVVAASTTPNLPRMANGIAGNVNAPTWVSVDTSSYVPPTAIRIMGSIVRINAVSGYAVVLPNDSYADILSTTNPPPVICFSASSSIGLMFDFELESSNIYWASDNSNGAIHAIGWVDNVNAS